MIQVAQLGSLNCCHSAGGSPAARHARTQFLHSRDSSCEMGRAVCHKRSSRNYLLAMRMSRARPAIRQTHVCCGTPRDLLVVGPGVLGSLAGKLWKDNYPDAAVVGQTNTTCSHDRLSKLGFHARTKDNADDTKFANVLFAAPPSGSDDYPAEVSAAADLWDGSGCLVFTSSIGVYNVPDGVCQEDSPLYPVDHSDRIKKLRLAEEAILARGGNVIRLVGLYHAQRGAHTFFLKKGSVTRDASSIINLIHYEDAAGMVNKVLKGGSSRPFRREIFIGGDDSPLTFQEMMDVCLEYGPFSGSVEFTGTPAPRGKTVNSRASKDKLQWNPKYSSFIQFMKATGGQDWYAKHV
eukprot:jgi/Ulvmu1/7356/UM036_0016.1